MKQYEAVIKVMEEHGGYANFARLYENVLKVPGCEWKTKTPYASIRRIVQDQRIFFKIKPGLWALNSHREAVLKKFKLLKPSKKDEETFSHTYYQGLLVELGNIKGFDTYIPSQDKNKTFLDKPLKDIVKLENIYAFSYPYIVAKAKNADVIWFNARRLPSRFFEVDHTTNFNNSLARFNELQDFYSEFKIVSSLARKREYDDAKKSSAFKDIVNRVKFLDYESLAKIHSSEFILYEMKKKGLAI